MTQIYISSDLHLGHKNISKYREYVSSVEENTSLILEEWQARINKRDIVYLLGDVAFNREELFGLNKMPGRKIIIRGNHDNYVKTHELMSVFEEVEGLLAKWGFWLSHAPIHPDELRKRHNIHGHVHRATVPDKRYFNACCDNLMKVYGTSFVTLQDIRDEFSSRGL